MHRYRTSFAIGLAALVVLASPAVARDLRASLAKTDAAESWAHIQSNLAGFARWTVGARSDAQSMRLADFAGSWTHHGFGMAFGPDGRGFAQFRVYRFCEDAGPGEVCDNPNGGPITGGGHAIVTLTRVAGRTAYGVVSESNVETVMPNGPISLTEYEHGIAYVLFSHLEHAPPYPLGPDWTLCGPRYADAPDWVHTWRPCGA